MTTNAKAWVIGESADSYAHLAAVGRRLAGTVEAVCLANPNLANQVKTAGVDVVWSIEAGDAGLVEDAIATLIATATEQKPDVVLFATTRRMRLVAAQLAAALKTCAINDASAIEAADDGAIVAEQMVYGGTAVRTKRVAGSVAIVLLTDGLLVNEPVADAAGEAPVNAVSGEAASGIVRTGTSERQVESVNLAAARAVVSVGRGIEKQEDLAMIDDLARVLNAEVGCTRPIAEGVNWLSRERYIGVSGATVKPNLFVAVGLSGQVQHMVGATGSTTIVAINKDKNAPIFKYADYGIVGDYATVVPQITAALGA